jgi:hypothetical protein
MTKDEHRERHQLLHKMFDELAADYLLHHDSAHLTNTTLVQLLEWAYAQTLEPTPNPYRGRSHCPQDHPPSS